MDANNLSGKKLLILAGNAPHVKVVEAAKSMGIYTIVTDYLSPAESPAKQVADEYWMLSYGDVETLVSKCRENNVDGVLACYHESALVPYYHICKQLNVPCYGDLDQFEKLTNKKSFKALCEENGIHTIPEYTVAEAETGNIVFPVMVKPEESCGSKGIYICNTQDELLQAIPEAKRASRSGEIIIERYIKGKNSFQVTFFFVNGEPYVIRTVDGYKGSVEDQLDRVALCSVSPSVYTQVYLDNTNTVFTNMLKKIGVLNGPVMVQGFYDDGVFRFYDPGRRFPGTDFEVVYNDLFGINLMKMMVTFALTGAMPSEEIKNENVFLNGKQAIVLFPTLCKGTVGEVTGFETLNKDMRIRNVCQKHTAGAVIDKMNVASQRIFEVNFISDSVEESKKMINYIQETITAKDTNGKNMIYKPFDVNRLQEN